MKDSMGMTLAMVAAEGGMVPIIRAVLRRITDAKASCLLTYIYMLPRGTYSGGTHATVEAHYVFAL